MTSPQSATDSPTPERDRMRDRQDMDYLPPVLAEPIGGPIPEWDETLAY